MLPTFVQEVQPFQFHKGTSKTCCVSMPYASMVCFNSIKVRVKPPQAQKNRLLAGFNSIKVRVKQIFGFIFEFSSDVSIP